jgi:acetyltransferase, GNAT family
MRQNALDLALRAWAPVFPQMKETVPGFVYDTFYLDGWQARQNSDLAQVLDDEPDTVDVALVGGEMAGWVCTRIHPEDSMGEVYVIAVDPDFQRQGIGRALMEHSQNRALDAGMTTMMVETGDDPGHAPARADYEAGGYQRWPVARYFKDLRRSPI